MSTALALASVTAVLKEVLHSGIVAQNLAGTLGDVSVTALPPDRIDVTSVADASQLNLFLYQVTPNAGWRNVGLPSRNRNGERVDNPPLALDLHYLLTAYGADEMHSEILLGHGMQWFHENPILARDLIRRTFTSADNGSIVSQLVTSELAEQVEQIKITPVSLGTEEISKLWTAFQAKYRPTAAYQVSVVLIQSTYSTKTALPVRARNIYVVPFQQPVIDQIKSQADSTAEIETNQPILAGYNLVLVGKNLRGEETIVKIDDLEVTPNAEDVTSNQIIAQIPSTLEAGVHGVQVVHPMLMGTPPVAHGGVESNVTAFVLRPNIGAVHVNNVEAENGTRSAEILLSVEPEIGESQRVILLLNEISSASPAQDLEAYSFVRSAGAQSPPAPADPVAIAVNGVKPGTYLVRIQVDGAESPLESDSDGAYSGPLAVIV